MDPVLKTVLVVLLRQVAPVLGGVGLFSDSELEQIAGGLLLLGTIAYHAYQRHQGKKAKAPMLTLMQESTFDLSQMTPPRDIAIVAGPTLREQGEQLAREIATTKANKVTVGGISDGKGGLVAITYDRKWSNGFGATAYFKAWRNATWVTPERSSGMMIGGEGSYDFSKR